MHNIELAVFDMAGTVVDEDNVVYKTLQKAINQKGYDLTLDFVLEHGAGKEKHQAIKDILAEVGADPVQEPSEPIFEVFKTLLDEAYENLEVASFAGVEETLARLKAQGVKIALNTGYNRKIAQLLLQKMKWTLGEQYDALITADDVALGRPHPAMIDEAMKVLDVDEPQKTIKVGDSIIDIQEGKNAQCGVTVGVTTGAHTREQLLSADPTYVLRSLSELTDYVRG